jgi:hypothetical protein
MKSLIVAAVVGTLVMASIATSKTADEKVLFEETFTDELGKGWSWVREDPKAWRIDKGALLIRTSTGSLWQTDNNNHNLLLRTPPEAKPQRFALEALGENQNQQPPY